MTAECKHAERNKGKDGSIEPSVSKGDLMRHLMSLSRNRASRLGLRSTAVAVVAILVAGISPLPASASASGCTKSDYAGKTCITVEGSGAYVSEIVSEHAHAEPWWWTVEWANSYKVVQGTWYSEYRESPIMHQTSWIGFWYSWNPNKNYPAPSYIYAYAYHDGAWQAGNPRLTIG